MFRIIWFLHLQHRSFSAWLRRRAARMQIQHKRKSNGNVKYHKTRPEQYAAGTFDARFPIKRRLPRFSRQTVHAKGTTPTPGIPNAEQLKKGLKPGLNTYPGIYPIRQRCEKPWVFSR